MLFCCFFLFFQNKHDNASQAEPGGEHSDIYICKLYKHACVYYKCILLFSVYYIFIPH